MREEMISLDIKFHDETFRDVNKIIDEETKTLETQKIMYSKMADVYKDIFKFNKNIKLESDEMSGNFIIDDVQILIIWSVYKRKIEFYFEEYWDIIDLKIEKEDCDTTIQEIVKAFENYYSKNLCYELKINKYEDYSFYTLSLSDEI